MNSNKKIAVCLPTYNESENIVLITQKLDRYLTKYSDKYNCIIVNADNNSIDGTNQLFKETKTSTKKITLLSGDKGKGNNLINYFNWCKENNIDYGITIDADVTSMTSDWIDKYLKSLIVDGSDYVAPIYRRSRYEGSTTNHFAFPVVYGFTGKYIRQPIAGDFAFNKKFIDIINKQEINDSIKQYGIDIFMTLTACCNNLKIDQIELGKKVHKPSYTKMEKMFVEVMDAALFVMNNYNINREYSDDIKINDCFLKTRTFKHKTQAIEMNKKYEIKNIDINKQWINQLVTIINDVNSIDKTKYDSIKQEFIYKATSFWLDAERISTIECENRIVNQAKQIRKIILEGE